VTDPAARLTLTPTLNHEGSIASIRVVELGDELVAHAVARWSPDGTFVAAEGHELTVEQFGVVSGRTYQVSCGAQDPHDSVSDSARPAEARYRLAVSRLPRAPMQRASR
jgi:hypothetical protein